MACAWEDVWQLHLPHASTGHHLETMEGEKGKYESLVHLTCHEKSLKSQEMQRNAVQVKPIQDIILLI